LSTAELFPVKESLPGETSGGPEALPGFCHPPRQTLGYASNESALAFLGTPILPDREKTRRTRSAKKPTTTNFMASPRCFISEYP
jgi:hypothetical protein